MDHCKWLVQELSARPSPTEPGQRRAAVLLGALSPAVPAMPCPLLLPEHRPGCQGSALAQNNRGTMLQIGLIESQRDR